MTVQRTDIFSHLCWTVFINLYIGGYASLKMQYTLDGKINALKQISQRKLLNILDKIPGRKDFIVDVNLIKPLEHIIGVAKLR